jgi:hypothetical protein
MILIASMTKGAVGMPCPSAELVVALVGRSYQGYDCINMLRCKGRKIRKLMNLCKRDLV